MIRLPQHRTICSRPTIFKQELAGMDNKKLNVYKTKNADAVNFGSQTFPLYNTSPILTNPIHQKTSMNYHSNILFSSSPNNPQSTLQETVKALIEEGMDLKDPEGEGPWYLSEAITQSDIPTLKCLIKEGVPLNTGFTKNGDLPINLALKNDTPEAADVLFKAGASLEIQNAQGFTPLLAMIYSNRFSCIHWLLDHVASLDTPDNDGVRPIFHSISKRNFDLFQLLCEKGADMITPLSDGTTVLDYAIQNHQDKMIALLLKNNIPITGNHSPLEALLRVGKTNLFKELLEKGATLSPRNTENNSLLHIASFQCNYEVMNLLIEKGMDLNGQNIHGETPLHFSVRQNNANATKLLLEQGASPNVLDKNGNPPFATALGQNKMFDNADLLLKAGSDTQFLFNLETSLLWQLVLNKNFTFLNALKLRGFTIPSKIEQAAIWRKEIAATQDPQSNASKFMVSLMADLLLNTKLSAIQKLLNDIESEFELNPQKRGYHPNEAELLLLLRHPEAQSREQTSIQDLTTCLTSISRFVETKAILSDRTLKAWGEIGFLTHAFRFWKHDAVSISPKQTKTESTSKTMPQTLLEEFGFQPFPDNRLLNDLFGKGFYLKREKTNELIEMRRGYLLISKPGEGTLIIRNSSPHFGRDLLKHPAYFIPKALTLEELQSFNPRTILESQNILNRSLYPSPTSKGYAREIANLVDGLMAVKNEYRQFKLDTEAFTHQEFTGHLSPGLLKLVSHLNLLKENQRPLPDLAFVHPDLPIYEPYPFGEDASGKPVNRLKLSPSILKEINDFISGQWSDAKYPKSLWIDFISKAGVENRGELVMLDGKGE
ncbi:MAG: ankyrin repeat domain-containing protein [Cyanobacteria bacterium]|nr:ankyrin repeat domain-containing protein [Cyanobacteriota bacterium]